MIFMIDNALSPVVRDELKRAGYDSIHVRDVSMQTASDEEIMAKCNTPEHVIVSADTDFGTLLARSESRFPSFILFRQTKKRSPQKQASLLISHIPSILEYLEQGSIVVFEDK